MQLRYNLDATWVELGWNVHAILMPFRQILYVTMQHRCNLDTTQIRVKRDSWSWSQISRLGLSRPIIGLGLDRNFHSRLVLVLFSFEILFHDKSWSSSCLNFNFKSSIGIGIQRGENQDHIKTKYSGLRVDKNTHISRKHTTYTEHHVPLKKNLQSLTE